MSLGLISSFGRTITVETRSAGSYGADGYWNPGEATTREIVASVQPMTYDEMMQLPENYRSKEGIKIYSVEKLKLSRQANNENADVVIIDGRRFEVLRVIDYHQHQSLSIRFYRMECVSENEVLGD